MAKDFRNLEDAEKGRQIADDQEARSREADYDWTDPTDIAQYHRDRRRRLRNEKLDMLVPDRICPQCGKRRIGSRSWVIDGLIAICRSCYFSE